MNELEVSRLYGALNSVLNAMIISGPTGLEKRLRFDLEDRDVTADIDAAINFIFTEIISTDPNSKIHSVFARYLRQADAVLDADWTDKTSRLSDERRALVVNKLKLKEQCIETLFKIIPVLKRFDEAVMITADHEEWYTESRKSLTGSYYWDNYKSYLLRNSAWDEPSVESLNETTDKVMRCLSDPLRSEAYAVRGLVVGYVQSGKTANFTGLIAKAIDSGYRLVVVLSGTLDSLRYQTQRRLDKELVGREQILQESENDTQHEYCGDQDWERFASYEGLPSESGNIDIKRITTSRVDYQALGQGRDVLRFEKIYQERPLNSIENIKHTSVRLVVIKKHPAVINKLVSDLKSLKMRLDDVPVLIIDDESDQASVNTINPNKTSTGKKEERTRTSTNDSITNLLAMFSRSQYVGYTATPAANTLINPNDSKDLFPRDFIELLPRPADYMGVSDFHDFDEEFNPLDDETVSKLGYNSNKKSFVREIKVTDDEAIFKNAIDAFILSGAIKLLRAKMNPGSVNIRHHTMLVHRAVNQYVHEDDRELVLRLYDENAYRRRASYARIWGLWKSDYEQISIAKEPNLFRPSTIEELTPYLDESLSKFENSRKKVLIVNGKDDYKEDMPDFDKESVWNILVGGSKLSRGYTVEGLTVTYFLRKTAAADTLMQMGRWFGFRRGYRDLVRLYIGTKVSIGRSKTTDLYELYESLCMDEERFRRRIQVASVDGIKPIQVPPLVPMGMLIPTQKNKMYNAEIVMENFGGKIAESGRVATNRTAKQSNKALLEGLLDDKNASLQTYAGTKIPDNTKYSLSGYLHQVEPSAFKEFLYKYKWGTVSNQFSSVISFLGGVGDSSPGIDSWIVAVLDKSSSKSSLYLNGHKHGAFSRAMVNDRFKVISEPRHREIAKHLSGIITLENPSASLEELTKPRQAVCLVYPVISNDYYGNDILSTNDVTIGLSLIFPKNSIGRTIDWRVKDSSREASAFVDAAI